jgi:CSLREA domain-containing protein
MKAVGLIIFLVPLVSTAATIMVNTTTDNLLSGDGRCTLREAIANVNAGADTTNGDCAAGSRAGDTVTFGLTSPAIIKLRAPKYGELAIAEDVRIVGPSSGFLAIDGRHRTRVFHITAGTTSMSDVTIQNGYQRSPTFAKGGGILVDTGATINLASCNFIGNRVVTTYNSKVASGGGGLEVAGTATLTNCTISGNTATGYGGVIYAAGRYGGADGHGGGIEVTGTATLTNCTISGNTANSRRSPHDGEGGGMEIAGSATLINCIVTGNTSGGTVRGFISLGGGIDVTGTATLTNCTISGNNVKGYSGGGGLEVTGTATLAGCTINNNKSASGGGIENTGTTTLTNCVLSGNSSGSGGSIENFRDYNGSGTVNLSDCTVSGNSGDGIASSGIATLTRCTLDGNAGAGILNSDGGMPDGGSMALTDCMISTNTGGGIINYRSSYLNHTTLEATNPDVTITTPLSGADRVV